MSVDSQPFVKKCLQNLLRNFVLPRQLPYVCRKERTDKNDCELEKDRK